MTEILSQAKAPYSIPDGMEDFVKEMETNGASTEEIKEALSYNQIPSPETDGPQPAEEDGEDSNILGNIGAGILQGIDKATENILSGIPLPDLGIQTDDGKPIEDMFGLATYLDKKSGTFFEIPEVDQGSITGNVTKGVSQALVGIIPATKFLKVMGVANRFVRGVVGGAIGDFATSGEEDAENLLKLIDMVPQEYGGEIADRVVEEINDWIVDPDSGEFDELKSRLLNTAPGIVIGVGLESVIKVAVAAKNAGPEATKNFINTISSRLRGTSEADQTINDLDAFDPTASSVKDASDRINKKISTEGGPVAKRKPLSELYRLAIDKLDPLKRAVNDLADGKELPAGANPYKLARLNVASASKANLFLENEVRSFKTGEVVGRGFREILKPISRDGKLVDKFRTYATSKRALELMNRSKSLPKDKKILTGLIRSDVEKIVAEGDGQFAQMFDEVVEYQDNVLQYLADSGVVSKKLHKAMKAANKDYVPFFRVMGDNVPDGSLAGIRNPIKAIKGSEKDIVDPLESIIKNTYLYVQMADRNEVLKSLFKLAGKAGDKDSVVRVVKAGMKPIKVENRELEKVLGQYSDEIGAKINAEELTIFRPQTNQLGPNQASVFVDGKKVVMEMDRDVADALKGMDDTSVNLLFNMFKLPATTLRAGAILDPEFFAKNMLRDNVTAAVMSKNGFKPFVDFFSGMASFISKDKSYKDWLYGGGAQATFVSLDRTYLRNSLKELTESSGLLGAAKNVITSPLEMLRLTTEVFENSTRIGEFKLAQKALAKKGIEGRKAMQEAAFESREVTLDFARMGSATRGVNVISAFFNARVQGYDRLVRAFAENPVRATKLAAMTITTPSALLWLRNHDDPRYQELPQWQKDMFWIVLTEDNIFRIPKPFELGIVFGTLPEHALEAASKSGQWAKFPEKAFNSLKQDIIASAIPTVLTPILEHRQNHSFFRGRPVVPDSLEGALGEDQFALHTNEISKSIAKLLASIEPLEDSGFDSPMIIENYIRQWTGGLGKKALDLAEAGLKKAGVYENRIEPTRTLADIPFVKGFVIRFPSSNLESIEKFYKESIKAEKIIKSLSLRKERLDIKGIQELVKDDPVMASAGAQQGIRNYKKILSDQRRLIELQYLNQNLSPDEKRDNIDRSLRAMLAFAKQGLKTIETFNKAKNNWSKVKPTK